jgi:predicted nucleic acid-binding protein
MIAVDTPILLFAVNRYAPEHRRAAALLEDLAGGDTPWAVTWTGLHEFLRRVTHRHAVAHPLAPELAGGFVREILASPSVRLLGPTARHAAVLAEVLGTLPAEEPVPDVLEQAVLFHEHGVRTVLTTDTAWRDFDFLTTVDPFRQKWPSEPERRRYRRLTLRASAE